MLYSFSVRSNFLEQFYQRGDKASVVSHVLGLFFSMVLFLSEIQISAERTCLQSPKLTL